MMSAEGVGLSIGFASLFITIIGIGIAGGKAYGKLQVQTENNFNKLDKLEDLNREGHSKLFDCQKETDIKVGKIEQHLATMNGRIAKHEDKLDRLEEKTE